MLLSAELFVASVSRDTHSKMGRVPRGGERHNFPQAYKVIGNFI